MGIYHVSRGQLASAYMAFAHAGLRIVRPNAGAQHYVNVLFHTANAVLLLCCCFG